MKNPNDPIMVLDIQVLAKRGLDVPEGHVLCQVTYPNHEKTIRVLRVDANDFYRWFTTQGEELRVEGGLL